MCGICGEKRFDGMTADVAAVSRMTEATIMLVDDPVKRVDNMTMAFGLEGRVPLLEMMRAGATSQRARERGLFKQSYVDKLLANPEQPITPLTGSELWQIALLELWLQTHVG